MAYNELIKNFERIRSYMRDFYVYGFKSREEYDRKSARSYDDERRRIESWLGDYMGFTRTSEGKNVFLSIDSRAAKQNPLYKAWKAKSFTSGDITLHFILFDMLRDRMLTMGEIMGEIDEVYLACFENPRTFDESTVRKKLKEYENEGLLQRVRQGKRVLYRLAPETDISALGDALHFFSETAPCGVVGAFLLEKPGMPASHFAFKHHYITHALDSDILCRIFMAMREKKSIRFLNSGGRGLTKEYHAVPLRIFISVQTGRQYLMAFNLELKQIKSYRLDYISEISEGEVCPHFDAMREKLAELQRYMWGVSGGFGKPEQVSFCIRAGEGEGHIVNRLEREKRCGSVERIDAETYRFSAEVYDTNEMLPWIRTFICRITEIQFSNKAAEETFKADLREMYRMYGEENA